MIKPNKSWGFLGLGVLLGAGAAYAADARYNTPLEGIDRAKTMLEAVGTNASEKPGAAFQRKRALKALERAKLRINCAKEIEDSTSKKHGCPAALKERFDDNDDDTGDHAGHHHKDHKDHKDHSDKGKAGHGKDNGPGKENAGKKPPSNVSKGKK